MQKWNLRKIVSRTLHSAGKSARIHCVFGNIPVRYLNGEVSSKSCCFIGPTGLFTNPCLFPQELEARNLISPDAAMSREELGFLK